jgi:hypothetical protein
MALARCNKPEGVPVMRWIVDVRAHVILLRSGLRLARKSGQENRKKLAW